MENSGGNSSAPSCRGNTTNSGAKQLKNLTDVLLQCEDNIHTACEASNHPQPNTTIITTCSTAMNSFAATVTACLKKTGSDACSCWDNSTLADEAKTIKGCDSKFFLAIFLFQLVNAFYHCCGLRGSKYLILI